MTDHVETVVDETKVPEHTENVSRNLISRKFYSGSCIYYLDLVDNPRGKFIKIKEYNRATEKTSTVFLPVDTATVLLDNLKSLLKEYLESI